MSNYRRVYVNGGSYFLTQVTYQRYPWLCSEIGRMALREAIQRTRQKYPFTIEAIVLLPDHFHTIWTLPPEDSNFSLRMRLIKQFVTKYYGDRLEIDVGVSQSRETRQEGNLWQRRFWEHLIGDERDFQNHCDYIHNNPVKHGLCDRPQAWEFSSIHQFTRSGIYPPDWVKDRAIELDKEIEGD